MTQYDVELLQRIEALTGKKMELFEHTEEEVMLFRARVEDAGRLAAQTMREGDAKKRKKGRAMGGVRGGGVDDEEAHAELMGEGKKFRRR